MTEQLDIDELMPLLARAKAEDLGAGDITSEAAIPADARAVGTFLANEGGVVCGLVVLGPLAALYSGELEVELLRRDGDAVSAGDRLAKVRGPARAMLAFERVALNFLQRLSGVAAAMQACVHAVAGTTAEVLDTRKTTPGHRTLEKYAVRCGGGRNHRAGLFDAVLAKDNHIALGYEHDPASLALRLRERYPDRMVEIEVDSLHQLHELLAGAGDAVDVVLLDNMTPGQLAEAVAIRDGVSHRPAAGGAGRPAGPTRPLLEASGGIDLSNIREVAEAGVDRISIGAITHSARALDISLEIRPG